VTGRPAADRELLVTREDALKFRAGGRTAKGLRRHAADPETVAGLAAGTQHAEDEVRAFLLDLADSIDTLAAEGLTPADCCDLLGWDREELAEELGAPRPLASIHAIRGGTE
jgi:hypothetical protein